MIGKDLGHYEIIELLGQGGMGTVYRARDSRLGREIALKILPAELAENGDFRQRFEREVKSLAALRHPNIVTIHSFEEAGGFAFYTMELVEGQPLDALLPDKGFPLDRLFQIAVPVADAVGLAHAHAITHRDLKPTNIMLDRDGSAKVLDFGLAKLSEPGQGPDAKTVPLDELETGEGRILGTAAYMSPEQANGKPADHRSDIFSLGIVLYEMATGQKPFTGDSPVSTLSSIIKDSPVSITSLNHRLPRHLWRIVRKCLEKEPDRRYQSVIDLRNDLEDLKIEIDSGELAAPPSATVPRDRRRGLAWLWSALAVVIVVAGWLGYTRLTREGSPDESRPDHLGGAVNLTRSGKVQSADLTPDGKLLAFTQRDQGLSDLRVHQLSTSNDIEILTPGTDEISNVQISPDGDLVYYLNVDRRTIFRISILGGNPQRMFENVDQYALSPDGRRLAIIRSARNHSELWLGDIGSGREERLREEIYTGFSSHLTWSCDGNRILFNALKEAGVAEVLMHLPLDGRHVSPRDDRVWGYIDAMNRLRDGSGLAVSGPRTSGPLNIQEPSELWFLPATGGEPVRLTYDPFEYSCIGSDKQGNRLTALQRQFEHTVRVMALENGGQPREVMYTSRAGKWWLPLDWTRSHRILYPALAGDEVHIWEVDSEGANRRRITTSGTFNVSCSVSPDGRTLAYASNLVGSLKIYLVDYEGGVPHRLTDGDGDEFFPQFSPDGQWVAYNIFTARRARVRKTSISDGRSVDLCENLAYMPSYSPDGLSMVCLVLDTLTYDYKMSIISADDGHIQRTLPNKTSGYGRIRWTPDGEALVYGQRLDDVDNLWLQLLDGGEPRQLTYLTSGGIAGFALSTDGDSLAVATMEEMGDVVMFEDYHGQIERALGRTQSNR